MWSFFYPEGEPAEAHQVALWGETVQMSLLQLCLPTEGRPHRTPQDALRWAHCVISILLFPFLSLLKVVKITVCSWWLCTCLFRERSSELWKSLSMWISEVVVGPHLAFCVTELLCWCYRISLWTSPWVYPDLAGGLFWHWAPKWLWNSRDLWEWICAFGSLLCSLYPFLHLINAICW